MEIDNIEYKKRAETVWGIVVAAIAGLALNLLGNTYYDLFVNKTTTWAKVDHMQIYITGLVLVAVVGLLNFFVADYQNNLEVNRSFLKRYWNYFFYNFTPGKVIRFLVGSYVLLVVLGVLAILFFFMAQVIGYLLAIIVFGAGLVSTFVKNKGSVMRK